MGCLKCGKDTKDEQVFCPRCMAAAEEYPVKPDVHIQLPNRPRQDLPKKTNRKRRAPSVEEQVNHLRARQRRLTAAIVALVLLLCAAGALVIHDAFSPEDADWLPSYTVHEPSA